MTTTSTTDPAPGEPRVLTARDGAIVTLTVNRPEARNALDGPTVDALTAAFEAIDADAGVRCVILTGAGDRAFVAGADIKAMAGLDRKGALAFAQRGHRMADLMEQLRVPIIAAVNGFALGAGLELALACDFIYAARTARMGMPEVGLGVIPGFGGTQRLALRVGVARARELIYSGVIIDADAALRIGLANALVDADQLMTGVRGLAETIARNAPLAVQAAKQTVTPGTLRGPDEPLAAALAVERDQFAALFATEDQKEGMRAFVEKRPPAWRGA
ncbi:MAG TPA: enoyl-CoA hydratase-related protein [Polyangia bacterium]|jgi:enoyl-CoA hydratase